MDPIVIKAVSFLAVFVLLVTMPLCKESPGFQSSSGAFLGLWRVRRFWKVNEIAISCFSITQHKSQTAKKPDSSKQGNRTRSKEAKNDKPKQP